MIEMVKPTQTHHLKVIKLNTDKGKKEPSDKLVLASNHGLNLVKTADIIFCESNSNYTIVHLTNGRQEIITKTLKICEDLLPTSTFFRIHKSSLINIYHISKVEKSGALKVVLENGQKLEVSRRKKEEFMKLIKEQFLSL